MPIPCIGGSCPSRASQNWNSRVNFGLADLHTAADMELRWNDGQAVSVNDVNVPLAFELKETSYSKNIEKLASGKTTSSFLIIVLNQMILFLSIYSG